MKVSQVLLGYLRTEMVHGQKVFCIEDQSGSRTRVEMAPSVRPAGQALLASLVGEYCEANGVMAWNSFVIDSISVVH